MPGLLVVGANGQVGWEVARRAGLAALPCLALTRADLHITQRDSVLRVVEHAAPSVVVNAAAYTAVDRAEKEPEIAFAVNQDGAAHLAEACARAGIPLIHISTDYVFDGRKPTPYREDDRVAPLGVYGASKVAGEEAVRRLCPRHIILRTAWVYGTHGRNFVKTMLRLARSRDRLRIVDDQRGSPTFAGDLAEAVLALIARLNAGELSDDTSFGTFHCAGEGAATWCRFARKIFAISGAALGRVPHVEPISTAEYPTPAQRPRNSVLDSTRLSAVHGIALRPWQAALAEMLEHSLALETSIPCSPRVNKGAT